MIKDVQQTKKTKRQVIKKKSSAKIVKEQAQLAQKILTMPEQSYEGQAFPAPLPHSSQLEATTETLNTLVLAEEDTSTPPQSSYIVDKVSSRDRDVIVAKYAEPKYARSPNIMSGHKRKAMVNNPDLINLVTPKQAINRETFNIDLNKNSRRGPANFKQLSPPRDSLENKEGDNTLEGDINDSGIYVHAILP